MSAITPGLHLIATPIGTARDITLRALDLLTGSDLLVAEDTRSLRRLMDLHGVPLNGRRVLPYHDHNGAQMRPKLLAALQDGQSVLYASEAGTPMVADPGYQLVRAVSEAGIAVHAAPGASAVLAALCVAGLPSDRFCFMGFPPAQAGARRHMLTEAAGIPATLVFYESPKRIHRFLTELRDTLGGSRQAALCRELTKLHEEVLRMSLDEMTIALEGRSLKGEIVLVVDRAAPATASARQVEDALDDALATMSVKDAASHVAQSLGLPRRAVYQTALERGKRE
jgi:16S rRNA (cytidine1402-2'-O)-methyltransferase